MNTKPASRASRRRANKAQARGGVREEVGVVEETWEAATNARRKRGQKQDRRTQSYVVSTCCFDGMTWHETLAGRGVGGGGYMCAQKCCPHRNGLDLVLIIFVGRHLPFRGGVQDVRRIAIYSSVDHLR